MVLGLTAHYVVRSLQVVAGGVQHKLMAGELWVELGRAQPAVGQSTEQPSPCPILALFCLLTALTSAPSTSKAQQKALCCVTEPKQVLCGVESTRAGATSRLTYLAAMGKAASQLSVMAASCQISSAEKQCNFKQKETEQDSKAGHPMTHSPENKPYIVRLQELQLFHSCRDTTCFRS